MLGRASNRMRPPSAWDVFGRVWRPIGWVGRVEGFSAPGGFVLGGGWHGTRDSYLEEACGSCGEAGRHPVERTRAPFVRRLAGLK
jgi:hypothetical protein